MKLYEVADDYIDYLRKFDDKVQSHKLGCRNFSRKYLGVILTVNNLDYFVPLSSYKPKHDKMKNSVDFFKVADKNRKYAVINFNNMIPVVPQALIEFDINSESDIRYRNLLIREVLILKNNQALIQENAKKLYAKVTVYKVQRLIDRCCDFIKLEQVAKQYK